MIIKTISIALLLLLFIAVTFSAVEATGLGGMRGFSGLRGYSGAGASGRSAFGGQIRLGRGRGGRRGGYNRAANMGPTVEQQQTSYFQERRAENPYSNVPLRINVSDYVRNYR